MIECSLAAGPPPLERLLGVGAFQLARVLEMDPGFLQQARLRLPGNSHCSGAISGVLDCLQRAVPLVCIASVFMRSLLASLHADA